MDIWIRRRTLRVIMLEHDNASLNFWPKNIDKWPQNIVTWPQNMDIWPQNIDIWPQNIDIWPQNIDIWPEEFWPPPEGMVPNSGPPPKEWFQILAPPRRNGSK